MTVDSIYKIIQREVIRTFSVLDSWFDEDADLLQFRPGSENWNAYEVLEHIMLTGHGLLPLIDNGYTETLQKTKTSEDFGCDQYNLYPTPLREITRLQNFIGTLPDQAEPRGETPVHEIRARMRDQLYHCLYQLDLGSNGSRPDVYQYIYFLALHGQRHLLQLDRNKIHYEETLLIRC